MRDAPGSKIGWLVAAFIAVAFHGVARLGYFADDFIFVDGVGRHPAGEILLGWHGIWPWYRPLAREFFFAGVSAAGAMAAPLAHGVSLLTLWVAADSLQHILRRRIGATAAVVAVALFLSHSLTYFLVGWLSGFQDVLALTLTLGAMRLQQSGRMGSAALCACMATFAKETGFIAFPLLALDVLLGERRAPTPREFGRWSVFAIVAASIHLGVRATWPARPATLPSGLGELQNAAPLFVEALTAWTSPPGPADWSVWATAILTSLVVFAMLRTTPGPRVASPSPGPALLGAAALISLAPALVPAFISGYPLRGHFFFPALPWSCALAAWALTRLVPGGSLRVALPLICGVLVWSNAPRSVDLDAPAGWDVGPLGWGEAQRIEARTRRLEYDVRELLGGDPAGLTVGYVRVPSGAWFQTGDGPATRVALGDPTLRAFSLRDLPPDVGEDSSAPFVLLDYDPEVRHRLVRLAPQDPVVIRQAAVALLEGRHPPARVLARYAARADSSAFFPRYLAALAALGQTGDRVAFARALAGPGPGEGGPGGRDPSEMLDAHESTALRIALDAPLSPQAHRRAADSLAIAHAPILEALELSVALQLDSTRAEDALRLGRLLANWLPASALRAYSLAGRAGAPAEIARAARSEARALGANP